MERKNIRMVVTDLDDTLLSKDKTISEEAVKVIGELAKKNVRFTFVTGRPPYAVDRFMKQVGVSAPVVTCNGAMIMNPTNGVISHQKSLDIAPWQTILEQAKNMGHTILVMVGTTEYALGETTWTKKRQTVGREVPLMALEDLMQQKAIYKLNIMEEDGKEPFALLIPQIQKVGQDYSLALYGEKGCEIVASDANKKIGLSELCEMCNVAMDEVMAIGDNENDLEMLEAAGIGVAVGNAIEKVKNIADYICEANYTDGVVEAIHKFVD